MITDMDYKQKYNEALNDMRAIYPNLKGDAKLAVEHAFPELRESEDERIRKTLIEELSACNTVGELKFRLPAPTREECIAWLEKQKEQKPNIELIQRSWYMEGYHDREFGKEPKWILKTGEGGPKHEPNPRYGQPLAKEQNPAEWHPTHEQMVALNWAANGIDNNSPCAGDIKASLRSLYNNLQSKSIRPAEWSEEDEKMMADIIDSLEYAYPYDNEFRIAWLKSLPERFNLQPKQEQNDYITPHKEFFKFIYDRLINVHKENPNVDYMRSFKERLNNLSFGEKQEWSEEDEDRYNSTIEVLQIAEANNGYNHYGRQEIIKDINWLKSLRLSWKPSKEQMNALNKAAEFFQENHYICTPLVTLYNQLKEKI